MLRFISSSAPLKLSAKKEIASRQMTIGLTTRLGTWWVEGPDIETAIVGKHRMKAQEVAIYDR